MGEALLIYELRPDNEMGRRLAAAWDAVTASEKACALEARGLDVGIVAVQVSERAVFAAHEQRRKREREALRPKLPAGYRIRQPPRIARSTARQRPWTNWRREWEFIRAAGGWTEWGGGHVDAPTVMALEGRGKLLVAEWHGRGRRRNLFLAID